MCVCVIGNLNRQNNGFFGFNLKISELTVPSSFGLIAIENSVVIIIRFFIMVFIFEILKSKICQSERLL